MTKPIKPKTSGQTARTFGPDRSIYDNAKDAWSAGRDACAEARTPDEIVHALCRFAWTVEHVDPNPMPAHMGMTAREVCELLPHVNEEVRLFVGATIGRLYEKTDQVDPPPLGAVRTCFEPDRLKVLHSVWVMSNEVPNSHPVYRVVRAAMKLKQWVAGLDQRRTGIQPRFLSAPAVPGNFVPSALRVDSTALDGMGFHSQPGDAWVYDLQGDIEGPAPALLLALLDLHAEGPSRLARVPIRDRLFVEAMMMTVPEHRQGTRRVDVSVRQIVTEWLRWSHYRPNGRDTGLALANALRALNDVYVPMNDRGGWWKPLTVPKFGGRRLTDTVSFSIYLPHDSDRGARVDRTAMRVAGKSSPVAWRLYLSLCYEWNRIAWRGKVPHLTRPEVKRDDVGYVLGADGRVLTNNKGVPQKSPYDKRAVRTGRREPNAKGERLHRRYESPADLVGIIWPLGSPAVARSPRRYQRFAVQAARWLAREVEPSGELVRIRGVALDEPAIRIVREGQATKKNPDGFPWRIVRPETI